VKRCAVSFVDAIGMTHTVTLEARSLFEAAAAGLEIFRQAEWTGPADHSRLDIRTEDGKKLAVTLADLRKWAARNPKSPAEQILKTRLNGLLDGGQRAD
jgi:hypothetical protein